MHFLSVLGVLEQMELALARLYHRYSEIFSNEPEVSVAFFRLYLDERSHATIIQFQRKLAWKNPKLFSVANLNLDPIRAAILRAEELLASRETPSVGEAMAIAGEFESGAAEIHYRFAVQSEEPSFNHLVSRLGQADRDHAQRLAEFASSWGCGPCSTAGEAALSRASA